MQSLDYLPSIMSFVASNWDSIAIVLLSLNSILDLLKKKQYTKMWPVALELVRQVSAKQLSGKEKRQEVVDMLMQASPSLVKRVISRDEMEIIVEEAYLFLRGELKEVSTQVEQPQ